MLCNICNRHKNVSRVAGSRNRNRRTLGVCVPCARKLGVPFKEIDNYLADGVFMRIKARSQKRKPIKRSDSALLYKSR